MNDTIFPPHSWYQNDPWSSIPSCIGVLGGCVGKLGGLDSGLLNVTVKWVPPCSMCKFFTIKNRMFDAVHEEGGA